MKRPTLPDLTLLATIVLAPMIWVRIYSIGGFDVAPIHLAIVALIATTFASPQHLAATVTVFRTSASVWIASAALVMTTMMSFLLTDNGFNFRDIARGGIYSVAAFCAAVVLYRAFVRQTTGYLVIGALGGFALFISLSFLTLASAGINPFALLVTAIIEADPNIIVYKMIAQVFWNSGYADMDMVRANLRHEIFFSLLTASAIPFAALVGLRSQLRLVAFATLALVTVLVLFSMSRSVWLAAAGIMTALGCVHVMRHRNHAILLLVLLPAIGFFTYLFALSDVAELLEARLYDGGSYSARIADSAKRMDLIAANPLLPEVPHGLKWAHNVVVDYWSAAGIIGLIVSLAYLGSIVWLVVRHALNALQARLKSEYFQSLTGMALAIIPLARVVTCPMGQLYIAEQVALGASAGLLAFWVRNRVHDALAARRTTTPAYRPAVRMPAR